MDLAYKFVMLMFVAWAAQVITIGTPFFWIAFGIWLVFFVGTIVCLFLNK